VSLACAAFEGAGLTRQLVDLVRSVAAAACRTQWHENSGAPLSSAGAAASPAPPASPFEKLETAAGESGGLG
jgi:hypothetical protein